MADCCPLPGVSCQIKPVIYLFNRQTRPKDKCEPVFGLQDSVIYFLGCFNGLFKKFPNESDRLILRGNPPLNVTDAWIVPGNTNTGYVIERSWRMGAITYLGIKKGSFPNFSLNILEKTSPNLTKQLNIPLNEQLILCGDRK